MKARNVKADNFTYSTLIKGIRYEDQNRDLDKAFQLFSQLGQDPSQGPDEILFNVLLDACINCGQLERAISLFKNIKEEGMLGHVKPDVISFNTIIKGCS